MRLGCGAPMTGRGIRTAVLAGIAAVLIAGLAADGLPLGEFALYVGVIVLAVLALKGLARFARWLGADPSRPCPRCGEGVKNGILDCPHCGFDFRTVGAPQHE